MAPLKEPFVCILLFLFSLFQGPIPGPPRPHQQQHWLPPWRTPRGGRGAGPLLRHRQTQVLRSVSTDICPFLAQFPLCSPVKRSKCTFLLPRHPAAGVLLHAAGDLAAAGVLLLHLPGAGALPHTPRLPHLHRVAPAGGSPHTPRADLDSAGRRSVSGQYKDSLQLW